MPKTIHSVSEFAKLVSISNKDYDKLSCVFIDVDGIVNILREFYIESELAERFTAQIRKVFAGAFNQDKSEAGSMLIEKIKKEFPLFADEVKRTVENKVGKLKEAASTIQRNEIIFDVICKKLAFTLAMEISAAAELESPVIPGNIQEAKTFGKALKNLLDTHPKMHAVFLTSRAETAAKNITAILEKLSVSSGLDRMALVGLIEERNQSLDLNFKPETFKYRCVVVGKHCIASGRNPKNKVIRAFYDNNGMMKTAFIDDKMRYIDDVASLLKVVDPSDLLIAHQPIAERKELKAQVKSKPELHKQLAFAMRNATDSYPVESRDFSTQRVTADAQALYGMKLLGELHKPESRLASQAAMTAGKAFLSDALTQDLSKLFPLSFFSFKGAGKRASASMGASQTAESWCFS